MPQQQDRSELDALTYGNLPNNTAGAIDPAKLREVVLALVASQLNLLDDGNPGAGPGTSAPAQQAATFGNLGGAAQDNTSLVSYLASLGRTLTEYTPPLTTQQGRWYVAPTGIWEAKSSFNAQAQPAAGAYWRSILDVGDALSATTAGKALLAAPSHLAQRVLVDVFSVPAGSHGAGQPAFTNAYGADGALVYLLGRVGYLSTQLAVSTQPAPGPTVTGFLPPSAAVGASVTLTGTGFVRPSAVLFNGTPASFQPINATTIVAVVPVGATNGPVAVTNALGTGTSAASFTVVASTTAPTPGDTTPPSVAFTVPAAGATLEPNSQVLLTVTANDNVAVQGLTFTNGATGAVIGAGAKNGSTYTFPYTTGAAGPLSLVATATDAAGNSQSATVTVTVGSTTTTPPATTTPDAPFPSYDPITRVLTFQHALGTSELEYNRFGGTFTGYAPIQVDDSSHNAGEWKARVKAMLGRNAGGTADSPAITAKATINQMPVVEAGDDLTITQPTSSVVLRGKASDPDAGDTLTYLWRPIAGPNTPLGLPATSLNVVVSGLVAGTYQFGFQATDQKGGKSQEDFVVVNVNATPTNLGGTPTGGDYITTDYITSNYIN